MAAGSPTPGSVVAWWEGSDLAFAVAAGEEKQRIRIVLPGGREERVAPSRIAFTVEFGGGAPGGGIEERRAAGKRAADVEERVRALAASVDVGLLWDLAQEPSAPRDETALAELALGSPSGESRAALVRALIDDGIRFVRKGTGWEPREPSAVEEILTQRRRAAERAAGRQAAGAALAAAVRGESFSSSGTEEEARYLSALGDLAIHDLDTSETSRTLALEALAIAGQRYDRPEEGAFRLLRSVGRFRSDDENLAVLRFGLRTTFGPVVVAAAREAASRGFSREGREDLTGLNVVTVDGPRTIEIDDAVSVEPLGEGAFRVGVHIADPATFIEPGGPLDLEALARATTHYLPEMRLPMLPEEISERAASLVEGEDRPALSFLADIGPAGEILGSRIVRSVIRSRARLTYGAADEAIRDGIGRFAPLLRALERASSVRERFRIAHGAIVIRAPEVEVHVADDGRIELERSDAGSPAQRVVSEAMILAGILAAEFCLANDVPVIFRRQPPPARAPEIPIEGTFDPVAIRNARKSLRRGEVGLQPGAHFALGVPAYAQATSPLRRYQDLATHRQIARVLEGAPPVYDVEALQRIAAGTEQAEIDGKRAERTSERYWLLRYLEGRVGEIVDGIVVEVMPRPVVLLLETLLEEAMPGLAGASLGEAVRLRIVRVNPRADLLVLRRA